MISTLTKAIATILLERRILKTCMKIGNYIELLLMIWIKTTDIESMSRLLTDNLH